MAKQTNTLYPMNYVEPAPTDPEPDTADNGRDFNRLRQIINAAVPPGGTPMTIQQLARIVMGCPDRGGGMVVIGVNTNNEVRAAALDPTMGITTDPAIQGIRKKEALAVYQEIWTAREPSWTFNEE